MLLRSPLCYAVLNTFPYNNGHTMIIPYKHTGSWEVLSALERSAMDDMLATMLKTLKKTIKPHGFNIGFNIGSCAGAGIAQHLHMHIVPRWKGDCNFMPVIADTKVIPQGLDELWIKINNELKK